jgi:hypothetical protein
VYCNRDLGVNRAKPIGLKQEELRNIRTGLMRLCPLPGDNPFDGLLAEIAKRRTSRKF